MGWRSLVHREDPITVCKHLVLELDIKRETVGFGRQQLSEIAPALGGRKRIEGTFTAGVTELL